jgi:TRAP-type C4-dicarboxylate transport system permease small subunit
MAQDTMPADPMPEKGKSSLLNRISRLVKAIVDGISALLFVLFTAVIVLQVILRYFTNGSLIWSEEFVRYALVWCVLIGSSSVTETNEHLKIDSIAPYLKPQYRRYLDVVVHVINLIFFGVLYWYGLTFMERVTFGVSAVLRIPLKYVYLAMPVGAVLMGVVTLLLIFRQLKGEETAYNSIREGDNLT